jgi:ABC-type sulfate transport system permease subunit
MDENAVNDVVAGAAATGGIVLIIQLIVITLMIVTMWKIFTKAGQPGWGILIPIYSTYVMLKVAGKPGWWLLLFFIPIVNIVIGIITLVAIAENFGKGGGFVVGMLFLPIIFYPILAFGSAEYKTQ